MDFYALTKALHIISVVAWFAGLFYLPRLFIYRTEEADAAGKAMLDKMAFKLSKFIMLPAMLATWLFGILLIVQNPALMAFGWLHTKLLLVLLLSGYHGHTQVMRKKLAAGTCTKSGKFFRMYNEIPTLFLIAIVLLAVLKPF